MKKIFTLILLSVLPFAIGSCSSTQKNADQPASTLATEESTQTAAADTTAAKDEKVTEFRIEDFGGSADGKTDNMPAVRKLTAKLQYTAGKKRIVFGEGSYRFVPSSYSSALVFKALSNLEIVGMGQDKTHMIIGNPNAGFLSVTSGKNISSKGFSIDFDPLPFSQGIIVAVDRDNYTYDLKIDEGFGLPTEPWFTEAAPGRNDIFRTSHLMDIKTKNFKSGVVNNVAVAKEVVDLGNRTYRFKTSISGAFAGLGREAWPKGQIEVGDGMVLVPRMGAPHLMIYSSCENTLYENIDVFTSGGFAVMNLDTSGTAIARNINIKRKNNRLITLNADAINFTACRAKPLVENCYIEANCDDSISAGSFAPVISKAESPTKLFVQQVAFFKLQKGDRVAVFNQREGLIVGESKIANVKTAELPEYGQGFEITLESPIEGILTDKNPNSTDILFTPDSMSSGITIRDTTIAVKIGRGVFMNAQDVLIENCKFREIAGETLMLANEAPNRANGYVSNVTIRNNSFENTTYGKKNWDIWSAVHVGTMRQFSPQKGDKYLYNAAEGKITQKVEIRDNTFRNCSANYIYLSAVKDAIIENNTMITDENLEFIKNDALIIADNSTNVLVKGNKITDKRSGLNSIIGAYGNTPKGETGIKLEGNTFDCSTDRILNK